MADFADFADFAALAAAEGIPTPALSLALSQERLKTTLILLAARRRGCSPGYTRQSKRRFRTALRKLNQKIAVIEQLLANTREIGRHDPAFDAAVAWLSEYRAKAQED